MVSSVERSGPVVREIDATASGNVSDVIRTNSEVIPSDAVIPSSTSDENCLPAHRHDTVTAVSFLWLF